MNPSNHTDLCRFTKIEIDRVIRRMTGNAMDLFESPKRLTFPVSFPDVPGYVVDCRVTHEVALRRLGPPMHTDWVDGLGNGDYWGFEYSCGLQVVYEFIHGSEGGRVVADSPELQHVVRHLAFATADCVPISDDGLKRELDRLVRAWPERRAEIDCLHAFQVWRQDDTGNSFTVGEPTSERDAKCHVRQLESRGHKQTYWYRRA